MFLQRKTLVSAILIGLSTISIKAAAQLSITGETIGPTPGYFQSYQFTIYSPDWGQAFLLGDPVLIDLVTPNRGVFDRIRIKGEEIRIADVGQNQRFQATLLGATDSLGEVIIEFGLNLDTGIDYTPVLINVTDSTGGGYPSDQYLPPSLDIQSPYDGQIFPQGSPILIAFYAPPQGQSVYEVKIGNQTLDVDWSQLRPTEFFRREFRGYTQTSGPLVITFKIRNDGTGEITEIDRVVVVEQQGFLPIQIDSPIAGQRFTEGDIVPVVVTPSFLVPNPRVEIIFDDEKIAELTQTPYRLDYRLTKPARAEPYRLVVKEFDGSTELDSNETFIFIDPPIISLQAKLKLEDGTSAIADGTSRTASLNIEASKGAQKLDQNEIKEQVDYVDFFVNGLFVERDTSPPYAMTYQYANSSKSLDTYSTYYDISAELQTKNPNYYQAQRYSAAVEAMPAVGAAYCATSVPKWKTETIYKQGEVVQFANFFYRANYDNQGQEPAESQFGANPWQRVLCSNAVIERTGIDLNVPSVYKAKVGDRVEIKGSAIASPIAKISLVSIVARDNQGEITLKTEEGKFKFAHLFRGEGYCYIGSCDIIQLFAINNLEYAKERTVRVEENIPPTIDSFYTASLGDDKVQLEIRGRDEGLSVTINVKNSDTGKVVASQKVQTYPSPWEWYSKVRSYDASLSFAKSQSGDYIVTVEDENGGKIERRFSIN